MAFFSEGTPGADPCGTRRSGVAGVDSAAGLTDFSRACLAAVVSISNVRPGGSTSAAFSSHSLGLLMAERRCTSVHTEGMSYGSGRRELFRRGDQPDDLLHASSVKVLAGIQAGSDFEFPESLFVLAKSHQAGGQGIVILGARLEPEGYAKFFFSLSQLLGIHERGAEIVVGQAGFRIERNGRAEDLHGFPVFSRQKQGLPENAVLGRSRGIGGDGG